MKSFAAERARDRAIRADEPEIEAELLRDREGEVVAPAGHEDNFNAGRVGAAKGFEIVSRNFVLGVEERSVDVGGY